MRARLRSPILPLLLIFVLACPRVRASGGGGGILLLGGGLVVCENLLASWAVESAADAAGYPTPYWGVAGYGLLGMAAAVHLGPDESFLLPLLVGGLAGNIYGVYRAQPSRGLSLSVGTKSLGLGPEAFSPGLRLAWGNVRLGYYRGDMGDHGLPGPNYAGTATASVERLPESVRSVDFDYGRKLWRSLRWSAGAGAAWAEYDYHDGSGYWSRAFVSPFLQAGLGYTFFDWAEMDVQLGWLLERNREREDFLRAAGAEGAREDPVQASLKMMLTI